MEFVTGAGGRRLDCVRRGRGAPLLLIQGMAAHHALWGAELLSALEERFDVVAYDHRGVGRGDRADEAFTTADLADDAAAVIASLGWADAHVFGISLGGMVAQELVLRHPAAVRTLALGCTTAGGAQGIISETSRRMVEAIATRDVEHGLRTSFEANLSCRYADRVPAAREIYRERALAVRMPVPVVLMQWAAAQAHDAADRLLTVDVPTLVLHGTADAGMPVANALRLAELIPAAQLELFDGAGHLFWWEDPVRTAALLTAQASAWG
ncbi:alpha/beta hydrolase [Kribbella sandramycini]|uniref:Alpha/beta hydrolase n=1 Tax=Kribbella sandramycini TaxID=60450 RepID=A0A7Y4L9U6_9ACTN|nr:alpha/beta hydrolase [Kribbella sandramycini]MBB6570220.1 pimeloyl-ACP methyl ester carboxylesterase [Kribbella sandramycini]NOL45927.1 alpha/beta hydrolase [Kribbella sandramycini]